MESYLLASLLGMGYLLSNKKTKDSGKAGKSVPTQIGKNMAQKKRPRVLTPYNAGSSRGPNSALGRSPSAVNRRDKPSMRTIYDSNHLQDVARQERLAAQASFSASQNPAATGVIPMRFGGGSGSSSTDRPPNAKDVSQYVRSPLTGQLMTMEQFQHNNMVPFFGGTLKQNMAENASKGRLEALTTGGTPTDLLGPKQETKPLFDSVPNVGNQFGMPVNTDTLQDRIATPVNRSNELPFQQERVGPGLNNYSAEPDAEDQYVKQREFVLPKTVDDLRTASNPKETFEGRTIESGLRGAKRGQFARMAKNRPDTTVELSPDELVPRSAAVKKERRRPDVIEAKKTEREDTSAEYAGAAYAGGVGERKRAPPSRAPHRQALAGPQKNPATATDQGRGQKDDFGRGSILIYANERDLTSRRTHKGNVTSAVKAAIAPLQDLVRTSKKEKLLEDAMKRPDPSLGGARPQIPSKLTVHDPDDVARTTIRQTTQVDVPMTNVQGGAFKSQVYDADDVARTTMRETTQVDAPAANVKGGAFKLQVYDADDVARTTLRETTQSETPAANIKGAAKKMRVHDPDDVARTTLKETTQTEAPLMNVSGAAKKSRVYDPDEVLRTTIRQTTQTSTPASNVKGGALKLAVYDADDVARTTVRETTQTDVPFANIQGGARKAIVHDPDDVARTTLRETTQSESTPANISAGVNKSIVHDPDDVARTTIKETTHFDGTNFSSLRGPGGEKAYHVEPEYFHVRATGKESLADKTQPERNIAGQKHLSELRDPEHRARTTGMETLVDHPRPEGNIEGLQGRVGGYEVADVEAPTTQKEVLSIQSRVGGAETLAGRGGGGYEVANEHTVVPETQKQVLSDRDYYGTAAEQGPGATTSYDSAYNAETNELRELTLMGREPTQVSTNIPSGSEVINLENTRRNLFPDDASERISRNAIATPVNPDVLDTIAEETDGGDQWRLQMGQVTQEPNLYSQVESDRLDPSLLNVLDENPLNIDVTKVFTSDA